MSKRLAQLLVQSGKSQSDLARAIGVTPQAVQQWLSGETHPRGKNVARIADFFGIAESAVQFGNDKSVSNEIDQREAVSKDAVLIPLMDIRASMGSGYVVPDQDGVIEQIQVARSWLRRNLVTNNENALRLITAFGDSMKGTFNDGDVLVIDTSVVDIRIDAVYALELNGELFVKRLQRRPDGSVLMISDNKKYEPYLIENDEKSKFRVLGRVLIALAALHI